MENLRPLLEPRVLSNVRFWYFVRLELKALLSIQTWQNYIKYPIIWDQSYYILNQLLYSMQDGNCRALLKGSISDPSSRYLHDFDIQNFSIFPGGYSYLLSYRNFIVRVKKVDSAVIIEISKCWWYISLLIMFTFVRLAVGPSVHPCVWRIEMSP